MLTVWTKHLKTTKEKEDFEVDVKRSINVLDRLKEILDESEKDLDLTETSFKVYDTPNWDYKQADINGFRRCLRTIKKVITLDQQNEE